MFFLGVLFWLQCPSVSLKRLQQSVSYTRSTVIFINTPISLIFKFLSYLRVTTGDRWLPPHWISVWDIMEPALVQVVSLSLTSPIPVPFGILSMSGILVLQASLSAQGRESLPFSLHRGLWAEQQKANIRVITENTPPRHTSLGAMGWCVHPKPWRTLQLLLSVLSDLYKGH